MPEGEGNITRCLNEKEQLQEWEGVEEVDRLFDLESTGRVRWGWNTPDYITSGLTEKIDSIADGWVVKWKADHPDILKANSKVYVTDEGVLYVVLDIYDRNKSQIESTRTYKMKEKVQVAPMIPNDVVEKYIIDPSKGEYERPSAFWGTPEEAEKLAQLLIASIRKERRVKGG